MIRQFILKILFVCVAVIAITLGQTQWTARTSGTLADLRSIVWTGEKLVAVGDSGIIVTSTDGVTWERQSSGISKNLRSIAWTGDELMAVGDSGTIVSSTNAINWANQSIQNSINITYVASIEGINYLLKTAEKVSDTIMLFSQNGEEWDKMPLTASNGNCLGLCWTGNKFYTAAWGGAILSSIDGRIWSREIFQSSSIFNHICWTGKTIIAVGESGYGCIITSTGDGSWQTNIPVVGTSRALYFVFGNDQRNIAVGDQGTILTSPDAETWTSQTSGTTRHLRCVTFTGTQFVAVGDSGTIITSPVDSVPVANPTPSPGFREPTIKSTRNLLRVELPVSLIGSSFSIYSLAGKKILESRDVKATGKFTISTGNLAPGVYQLIINHKGRKLARSFVVNR